LRGAAACADNWAVPGASWQKRVARAEELAIRHPFAAELLLFYVHLARFQERLYPQVVRGPAGGFSDPLESESLLESSEPFLLMIEERGPARLADVALGL